MEDEDKKLRMAVIAGASKALQFKSQAKSGRLKVLSDEEVLQLVTEQSDEIIARIDDPLY